MSTITAQDAAKDYRATVFLPRTDFPMRASLPAREPEILERWARLDLYRRQREAAAGREKFVLHDGPPYANGHLHMGTAFNKILKDVVNRNQQMLGKDAVYVPGWDCHGLPIEWQIEQRYRKEGLDKDAVPIAEFRRECREFAEHWIDVQRSEFVRLGVIGDWDHPYTTMAYAAEAGIYRELGRFLLSGQLYRGKKSVMWSVVEKTALADAEVEYHDHTSTTITVRFPVVRPSHPALEGASAVIWTTTPWTIPGNRAVAYGDRVDYRVIEVEAVAEGAHARVGERLLLAAALQDEVAAAAGITRCRVVAELEGAALAGTVVRHPLHGRGYDLEGPMLAADFVTTEQGTGLVHIAPSHGADDFELGARHGLDVPDTVGEDGVYAADLPLFGGLHVFKAALPVIEALQANGALLAQGKLVHSYPHSWRSKAPLIFRATPQWFIPMDGPGELRAKALAAIDATRWVPAQGRNRIRGMVESRPDWCVSRQRAWGVPIALFVDKATGEVLRDP
jgi:isoleucyl-tRNA synthetase